MLAPWNRVYSLCGDWAPAVAGIIAPRSASAVKGRVTGLGFMGDIPAMRAACAGDTPAYPGLPRAQSDRGRRKRRYSGRPARLIRLPPRPRARLLLRAVRRTD